MTLKNVINAFVNEYMGLIQLTLLWAVVIYLLSFFAFSFAFEDYGFLLIEENQCTYLFNCFLSSFENIENDRTIQPSFRSAYGITKYSLRTWWNVVYTVLNKYIIKNINAALIIGAFAGLRSKRAEISEDDKQKCFVCNIDRYSLDKYAGFAHHTTKEHNIWNYFYFAYTLSTKDQKNLKGIESYVAEKVPPFSTSLISDEWKQIDSEDGTWLPEYRAKSMDNVGPHETKDIVINSFERLDKKIKKSKAIIQQKLLLKNQKNTGSKK